MRPRPFRVLVVDDEPGGSDALVRLLQHRGVPAAGASDPRVALEMAGSGEFAAMITDLRMEGLDGLELVRKARAGDPSLRFAILTGYGSLETAVAALREGVVDFLTKPCLLPDLLRCIDRLRGEGAAAGREDGSPSTAPPASSPAPACRKRDPRDLLWPAGPHAPAEAAP